MSGATPPNTFAAAGDLAFVRAAFAARDSRPIPSGERTIVSRDTARIDPAERIYRARYDVSVRSPSGEEYFEHDEILRVLTIEDGGISRRTGHPGRGGRWP